MTKIQKPATTSVPISDLLANRWSPRVYDPNHIVTQEQVSRLAEAARWAASGNNAQPWRFAFTLRGEELFEKISGGMLSGFNASWAPQASLYVLAFANKFKADGSELDRHAAYFNNALATSQLVFEAEAMGLKAHYMGGVLHDEILRSVGVEDAWLTCVITIGAQGDTSNVSAELQQREAAPRERKALAEIVITEL
jgi:nitroreductase